MHQIAEEAGLSVGALYRYFDGKEDLVRALAEAGRSLNRSIRRAVMDETGAMDELLALVRRYFELLSDPEERGTLVLTVRLWAEALDSEAVGEELRRTYEEQVGAVRELLLSAAKTAGGPARHDPDAAARVLIALLNDVSLQLLIDPELDLEAYATVAETVIRGLAGRDG